MPHITNVPMREKLLRDCQAWPQWIESLCEDVDTLVKENRQLQHALQWAAGELSTHRAADRPEDIYNTLLAKATAKGMRCNDIA